MKKILIILFCVFSFIFIFSFNINRKVEAANSKIYFNYTLLTTVEDIGYTNTTSGNNFKELSIGEYTQRNFSVEINTTKDVLIGGYINVSNVSIIVKVPIVVTGNMLSRITKFTLTKDGTNVSNQQISNMTSSLPNEIYSGTLQDGLYNLSAIWECVDSKSNGDEKTKYTLSISSRFNVDTVKPSITYTKGDTTMTGSIYSNISNSIVATDSNLDCITMFLPSGYCVDYNQVSGTAQTTILTTGQNGLYSFYAKDLAGNKSDTIYYYLDTVAPNISFKIGSINYTNLVNGQFDVLVSDNIDYDVYIKGGVYPEYTKYIKTTLIDGEYTFKAVDKAGNTIEKSIILDTTKPTCYFSILDEKVTKTNKDISIYATDINGISKIYLKEQDDLNYVEVASNTKITEDGIYNVYSIDNAGNISNVESCIVDKTPPNINSSVELNSTCNRDFSISITDSNSCNIYLKKPGEDYVKMTDKTVVIECSNVDGKYYFYGVDEMGNTSQTYYINLQVPSPIADRYESNGKVKYTFSGDIVATLNGVSYTGEWVSVEGEYTLVLLSSSGRSSTYNFSISHYYTLKEVVKPTCSEKGYSIYTCQLCGGEKVDDYVEMVSHDYLITLVSKTCVIGTHYHYACKNCVYQYDGDELDIPSHSYVESVINPTCIERGYVLHTCTVCHDTYADNYVDKLGHLEVITVVEPKCDEDGYTHHTCSRCDILDTKDNIVEKLGHNYEDTIIKATCNTNGYTKHVCSRCKDSYLDSEVLAKGHQYIEESIEVNCIVDGCIKHTCLRCGYHYETDIVRSSGHNYIIEVLKEATCNEEGERYYLCSKCGDCYTEIIHVKGHNYSLIDEYTEGESVMRKYRCKDCEDIKVEEYSTEINGIAMLASKIFEKVEPYIFPLFISFSMVWSSIMGLMYIFAKREDELMKARTILKNYIIGICIISIILVGGPYLLKGIGFFLGG